MKRTIYIIFTFLTSIFLINIVNAEDTLKYENIYNYSNDITLSIDNITSNKDGYIVSTKTDTNTLKLLSYDNTHTLITTKELPDITNANIIKYNDNYLVAGISSNTLKLYILDSNLQVLNQQETTYFIDLTSKINLYIKDNKAYIMLTEYEVLSNNNIYEIDENLTVTENPLSSYDATILKDILKSDYYIIRNNDIIENYRTIHYNNATYTEDNTILVGNININEYSPTTYARLTILDNDGVKKVDKEIINYSNFIKALIIKERIIILATSSQNNYLLTYDFNGNLIKEEKLLTTHETLNITPINIFKVSNKVAIHYNNLTNNLLSFYTFECFADKTASIYGTIDIEATTHNPYEEVELSITPNSGYEVESIIVKDSQGNIIPVNENKFVMPENDCIISVEYTSSVVNPETVDMIVIVSIISIVLVIVVALTRKKLNWLE